MVSEFYGMWPDFYTWNDVEHRRTFEDLFAPLRLPQFVDVVSVFNARPWVGPRFHNRIKVGYSGEPFNLEPTDDFDVNLLMRATDVAKKVVCAPLLVFVSHGFGCWPLYSAPRPQKEQTEFCAFVISNAGCKVRNEFFRRLSGYKLVHSCGPALNNRGGECAPRERQAYFAFLSRYKFVICFENNAIPEYLTEKLANAWLGGTVPIYWGARRALDWLNPKAFLWLEPEATAAQMDALVQRVAELDCDPAKYAEVFAQPLVREPGIPEELSLDHIRGKIKEVLALKFPALRVST